MSVIIFGGPIEMGLTTARGTWQERRGLFLEIEDAEGFRGVGEASPLPGYSPETLEDARKALSRWEEKGPPRLDDQRPILPQVRAELETIDPAVPSARFAVETALLDLAGHRLGRPVWSLLGGENPSAVPLSALLRARTPETIVEQTRAVLERGITTVKVKVGLPGAFEHELALLAALRAALGSGLRLRLDANGGFAQGNVAERLAALARFEPELIEEPVSGPALFELEASPIPLAADESLQIPGAWQCLEPLRRRGLLHAVVLKPMVLGGGLACLDLARRAAAEGVGALVTHFFDGPVALAAAAHLALALPGERLACGLDRHPGLAAWPAAEIPWLTEREILATSRAGLGLG